MTRAFAGFVYQRCHDVARQFEQALKALCLLVWVDIDALRILDLSLVLQTLSMTSTTMESCTL